MDSSVGEVILERPVFEKGTQGAAFFPLLERHVRLPSGTIQDQVVWDRRGRTFVMGVVITVAGDVLLLREPKYGVMANVITLPGGGVKHGESPEHAIARETFAETGYVAESWHPVKMPPLIDFPDKVDGGEHRVFIGVGAVKMAEPKEPGRLVIPVPKHQVREVFMNEPYLIATAWSAYQCAERVWSADKGLL